MDYESLVVKNDFPEGIREFVDVVGMDVAMDVVDYCGGGVLYFPSRRSIVKNARNRVIKQAFDGGNFREIAKKYGISEMQVRNILKN